MIVEVFGAYVKCLISFVDPGKKKKSPVELKKKKIGQGFMLVEKLASSEGSVCRFIGSNFPATYLPCLPAGNLFTLRRRPELVLLRQACLLPFSN